MKNKLPIAVPALLALGVACAPGTEARRTDIQVAVSGLTDNCRPGTEGTINLSSDEGVVATQTVNADGVLTFTHAEHGINRTTHYDVSADTAHPDGDDTECDVAAESNTAVEVALNEESGADSVRRAVIQFEETGDVSGFIGSIRAVVGEECARIISGQLDPLCNPRAEVEFSLTRLDGSVVQMHQITDSNGSVGFTGVPLGTPLHLTLNGVDGDYGTQQSPQFLKSIDPVVVGFKLENNEQNGKIVQYPDVLPTLQVGDSFPLPQLFVDGAAVDATFASDQPSIAEVIASAASASGSAVTAIAPGTTIIRVMGPDGEMKEATITVQ